MRQKAIVRFQGGEWKRNAIFQLYLCECHANKLAGRDANFRQDALCIRDATFVDARSKHHGRITHGTTVLHLCRAVKPVRRGNQFDRKLETSPRLRQVHTQVTLSGRTLVQWEIVGSLNPQPVDVGFSIGAHATDRSIRQVVLVRPCPESAPLWIGETKVSATRAIAP